MTSTADVTPTSQELSLTLQRLGWRPNGGVPTILAAWTTVDESAEVVVPLDSSKGDFEDLMRRALRSLVRFEGAVAERTLQDVLQGTRQIFDVSRFVRDSPHESGVIGWLDGKSLFTAAEQCVMAAARSTRAPRKYHGNASSYISQNVLQSAFMGQTEIGSFVVRLLTQPNERFPARKADEPKVSQSHVHDAGSISNRRVLLTLESALLGTRSALDDFRRLPKLDAFSELVDTGVSSELLQALALVSQDVGRSAVSLDFSEPGRAGRRQEIEFSADEAPVLERASQRLLEDPEPTDVTVTGDVTMLERVQVGGAGIVRLRVRSGADAKSVRIRISSAEYNQVLEAHRDGVALQVSGRLEREGKYSWIYGVSSLGFVEESESGSDDSGDDDLFSALDDDDE